MEIYNPTQATEPGVYRNSEKKELCMQKPTIEKFTAQILSWLSLQFTVITIAVIYSYNHHETITNYKQSHPGTIWIPIICCLLTLIGMYKIKKRNSQIILFSLFTATVAAIISYNIITWSPNTLVVSTIATTIILVGIMLYSWICCYLNKDVSIVSSGVITIISTTVSIAFLSIKYPNSVLQLFIAIFVIMMFVMYVIADIYQMYKNPKYKQTDIIYSHAIFATSNIYINIIEICINIITCCKYS